MKEKLYNREQAITYAKEWAYRRNPKYYNFDAIGGDCTSFVSQCLYAGSGIMNYNQYNGWYYNSVNSRSPSWTGVEFLFEFLTTNQELGPSAKMVDSKFIQIGDVIQLKFYEKNNFSHSLLVVDKSESEIYIASHTDNAYHRALSSYAFEKVRFLHIDTVMTW